jgi:hypothetical protein
MASIREQIVAAFCAALNAPAGKPCTTYRTRVDAFSVKELPAMVVFAVKEAVTTESSNTVLRKLTLRVEILVEGEPPADLLIDPLYLFILSTLDSDSPKYLDCPAVGIRRIEELSTQFETEASYQDATVAIVDFDVVFATRAGDPTVKVMG